MRTQTLSTQKIVILLLFICGALMASVFLYHLKPKPSITQFSRDFGTIFPVPRDIKAFALTTSKGSFTEKSLRDRWTLLFFGFTHCSNVCPVTLTMISKSYPELYQRYPNLQVVLVSLDPERDSLDQLNNYTTRFHKNFIGVTGKIQELRKLQSQLGIFSARDNSSDAKNYQIQHTSSILLINPQGKFAGLFRYGLSPDEFKQAYQESMQIIARG